METSDTNQVSERQSPPESPGIYNPVDIHVQDSLGALILGILSIVLLVGWIKSEERNRQLLSR